MTDFSVLYIQASRWAYGYLDMAKTSIADLKTYTPERVKNYADKICGKLKGGYTLAAGVSDDGKAIQWTPNPLELVLACGDPGKSGREAGANNGKVIYNNLRKAMRDYFATEPALAPEAKSALPIFAVIDTDSFHHMSAPLVERAFARLGDAKGRKRIVINFDAHVDYTPSAVTEKGELAVTCQSWGTFVSNDLTAQKSHGALADAYIELGMFAGRDGYENWKMNWNASIHHLASDGYGKKANTTLDKPDEYQMPTVESVKKQLAAVLEKLKAEQGKIDAYVSVDRDVSERSFTQYDDGPHSRDDVFVAIDACLTYLSERGAILAGFDVTGLPVHPGVSSRAKEKLTIPEAMEKAAEDVQQLYAMAIAYKAKS